MATREVREESLSSARRGEPLPPALRSFSAAASSIAAAVILARSAWRTFLAPPTSSPARLAVIPSETALLETVRPGKLHAAERVLVDARRRLLDPAGLPDGGHGAATVLGLALSGGGIRSATFCLGFIQALSARRLLSTVDYLSTVSGGGYTGSFLGALFARPDLEGSSGKDRLAAVMDVLANPRSQAMCWLRENGRYLSPNGSGDILAALAAQLRNWFSVVLVMGLSWLTVFLCLDLVRAAIVRVPSFRDVLSSCFPQPAFSGFWWLSPAWLLVGLAIVPAVLLGWTAWLIPRWREWRRTWPQWAVAGLVCASSMVLLVVDGIAPTRYEPALWMIGVLSGMVLLLAAVLFASGSRAGASRADAFRRIRVSLNNHFGSILVVMLVVVAIASLDTLGQSLYLSVRRHGVTVAVEALVAATGLASLVSLGNRLSSLSQFFPLSARRLPLEGIALAVGVVGVGVFLLNLNILGHAIAWNWGVPAQLELRELVTLSAIAAAGAVFSWLLGWHVPFLNQSSLQTFYGSRLARSYLGASNPNRLDSIHRALTELAPGDDIWLSGYAPHARGGPLHLINLTFNETCPAEFNIEHRDRKGLPFAVGPSGISVGRTSHALWYASTNAAERGQGIVPISGPAGNGSLPMFPPTKRVCRPVENLSIGHWIALSGAAIGTGTGSHNCLGFSLLAGLTNVRLGYWWDSNVEPWERAERTPPNLSQRMGERFAGTFPVQSFLLDEWLARFHGPARRLWYLSDGGHFENTGVYELIRRRLPHIICCDCGQDGAYSFADVANLVRKARIDFDAEVCIFDRPTLDRLTGTLIPESIAREIGAVEEFAEATTRKHHALLAAVRYEGLLTPESFILFIKPTVAGDESADVQEYQCAHPGFPHEATADQFFDEAQWESYRKLGEHTGEKLLRPDSDGEWWFMKIRPDQLGEHCAGPSHLK